MPFSRRQQFLVVACLVFAAPLAGAEVKLEQVISREDPAFNPANARMTVGKDGKVYLSSVGQGVGYVLRFDRDGGNRFGGVAVYAIGNATANRDGIVASANAHFAHKVVLYDAGLRERGAVDDFLNNDVVGWSGPPHVEAGASGDFYGLDHNRDRIVRLSAQGKLLKAYPYPRDVKNPASFIRDFRVCEKTEAFYLLPQANMIRCVGFDGKERWSVAAGVSWSDPASAGGFDVDEEGTLYAMGPREKAVRTFDATGKPTGNFPLDLQQPLPAEAGDIFVTEMRVHGGDIVLRQRHGTELFQTYSRQTGKLLSRAAAEHERLTASFPARRWQSNTSVPLTIQLAGRQAKQAPSWRIWLRSLDEIDYRELTWREGKVEVPGDLCGIYVVKISPEITPWQRGEASEYLLRTWVEIRPGDATGTLSVWTTTRRSRFGAGEPIEGLVQLRGQAERPEGTEVKLVRVGGAGETVASGKIPVTAGGEPASFTLSGKITRGLRPGNYLLTASLPGVGTAGQPLVIGPGGQADFPFMQYGDYTTFYPQVGFWDLPDAVAAHVAKAGRLRINRFVDRLGIPLNFGAVEKHYIRGELDDLKKHLEADRAGPALGKVEPVALIEPTLSAYAADGIDQLGILMYNDAGLPVGTGFDNRKPEQILKDLEKVTRVLAPVPSFYGWSWASNWWVFQGGANAARTPKERSEYEAALKVARETGAWNPVLDLVADFRWSLARDAQEQFNKALKPLAEKAGRRLRTASAAPYRNAESYPPISLGNVDEVDLQAQWEQIAVPYAAAQGVDFYKRPGKRAWFHPEIWNDAGTGEQVVPTLWQAIMRGANGVGCSGPIPPWGRRPADGRIGYFGTASVFRAMGETIQAHGPFLNALENNGRVAIVVSARQLKVDNWSNVYAVQFARLLEAHAACLHARHPATYVFPEDLQPGTLEKFKALVVVGQTVAMEPSLAQALDTAAKAGVKILHDGTCRPELVKGFTPLGVSFNRFEKDPSPASDDEAHRRFPAYAKATAPALAKMFDAVTEPVARCPHPDVLFSERKGGKGRFLFVVNQATPDLEPGQLWRTTLFCASTLPVKTEVALNEPGEAVYDVFAGKEVAPKDGKIDVDLRALQVRLYALLPSRIAKLAVSVPKKVKPIESFSYGVEVLDAKDKPIAAPIPLHVCLRDGKGQIVKETYRATSEKPIEEPFMMPVGLDEAEYFLEATELFSGIKVRKAIGVDREAKQILATIVAGKADPSSRVPARAAPANARTKGGKRDTRFKTVESRFGPHIRDVAISGDGKQAVMNLFNWDSNLIGMDLANGKVQWQKRLGHYFTFAPQIAGEGVAVQGFDYSTAEGYHLYLVGADGQAERRFGLYGIAQRLPHRFVPGMALDRINNFAVARDGSWVASAGDLGLAVWSRDGKNLWSQDWWKKERKTVHLAALDGETLLVVDGMKATAYRVQGGKEKWTLTLASSGSVKAIRVDGSGSLCAIQTDTNGGRMFLLEKGKLKSTFPIAGDEIELSSDGQALAVTAGNTIKLFGADGGLRWSFSGDDTLHMPRFSPEGQRLAVGSELGTLTVLDLSGKVLLDRDMEALPVSSWLPDGDLVSATWMGIVERIGPDSKVKWRTRLQASDGDAATMLLAKVETPATRIANWGNAEPTGMPVSPNLLDPKNVRIDFRATASYVQFQRDTAALVDGKSEPPAEPWLAWHHVGGFAEGSSTNSLTLDTFFTRLKVTAITLVEDPKHPESWVRDARLEAWDPANERWQPVMPLLSDQAVHTHKLPQPVTASRWRIAFTPLLVGNLRLAEIALHGEAAGSSHPDVIAKKPVATLFDEADELKEAGLLLPHLGGSIVFNGAFSGGRCIEIKADGSAYPPYRPPFGHVLPNWDFEVVEKPEPGQYRYLVFAARSLSPQTKGLTVRLDGIGYGNSVSCYAGTYVKEDDAKGWKVDDAPSDAWKVYRVDLWEVLKKPQRIRGLRLAARGGPAAFDRILLSREEK